MTKRVLFVGLTILSLCGVLSAEEKDKVLLLMQEKTDQIGFMIRNEVKPMIRLLHEAGYDVVIATETGMKVGYGDVIVQPDLKYDKANIRDYKGLIIPCMAVRETKSTISPVAVELAASAFKEGIPIAAQNSGVTILGQAKVLQGKKYAIEERYIYLVEGGIFQGNGIVKDGKIVTSGICPWLAGEGQGKDGTAELTKAFIDMLKK